jgi:purine-nucleoside phosphorylase
MTAGAIAFLQDRIGGAPPEIGLILGSGLGALANELAEARRVPFDEVPGFAPTTVEGHPGMVVAGRLEGVRCIALQGRYHLYEGHDAEAAMRPVRALLGLGARTLIITNAAGGVNPRFRPGDLMIIDDHINLTWRNPLIGPVVPGEERFPDMAAPYDRKLQKLTERVALESGIRTVRGVYCSVLGPSYETPAEIRAIRTMGADAVGMSTVPEVLVARAAGARVLGISLISNAAAGLTGERLAHEEVVIAGVKARSYFGALLRGIVARLGSAAGAGTAPAS